MNIQDQELIEEHIKREFQIERYLGRGSYGKVWKAIDPQTQNIYAIKKIFGAFRNCTDAKRTVREVCFLYQLSQHENIVRLEKVIKSQNPNNLYLVFEYLGSDLHKIIQQNILLPIHQKYIIYQILLALQYIHSGGLIHRDLKPSNLLINKQCIVKLADFGLARCIYDIDEVYPVQTVNVATLQYRAPEILFGSQIYSYPVDMWSVGCILFEMLIGKPMCKEENNIQQILRIIELLGIPSDLDIQSFQLQNPEKIKNLIYLSQQKQKQKQTAQLNEILNKIDEKAKDFIMKCIKYNPQERMTASQALQHPFVKEFKGHLIEQLRDQQIIALKNDQYLYSVKEYQDILYKFLDFNGGDIHKFINQNNKNISKQVDQNNRNIIQSPIKYFSQNNSKHVQMRQQTQPSNFGPHIQTVNKDISSLKTLEQCDYPNTTCENKNISFHSPISSKQIKKICLNHLEIRSKNRTGRLSLQTNYSQQSNTQQYNNIKF